MVEITQSWSQSFKHITDKRMKISRNHLKLERHLSFLVKIIQSWPQSIFSQRIIVNLIKQGRRCYFKNGVFIFKRHHLVIGRSQHKLPRKLLLLEK